MDTTTAATVGVIRKTGGAILPLGRHGLTKHTALQQSGAIPFEMVDWLRNRGDGYCGYAALMQAYTLFSEQRNKCPRLRSTSTLQQFLSNVRSTCALTLELSSKLDDVAAYIASSSQCSQLPPHLWCSVSDILETAHELRLPLCLWIGQHYLTGHHATPADQLTLYYADATSPSPIHLALFAQHFNLLPLSCTNWRSRCHTANAPRNTFSCMEELISLGLPHNYSPLIRI